MDDGLHLLSGRQWVVREGKNELLATAVLYVLYMLVSVKTRTEIPPGFQVHSSLSDLPVTPLGTEMNLCQN
jgi:hypothetical protein